MPFRAPVPKLRWLLVLSLSLAMPPCPSLGHELEPPPTDCLTAEEVPLLVYGGSTVNCTIDPPGDSDRFEFLGLAGNMFRLILLPDAFLDPHLVVRGPEGDVLLDELCDGGTEPGPPDSCLLEIDLGPASFPISDLYEIELSDQGDDEAGGYQLQLEIIPSLQPSELIPLSRESFTDFAVLETATDVDQYAFEGLADERISLELAAFRADLDPRLEIFDPDGLLLERSSCQGGPATPCTTTAVVMLPEAGRYSFAVSDEGHDDFGSQGGYDYLFVRLPEPSATTLGVASVVAVVLLARRRRRPTASSAQS